MITPKKVDKNPTSINILKLQRYNFKFFSLEEVVFFEYLVVKGKAFLFKPFYHSSETIAGEIGIKRTKLDTIIGRFTALGIINVEVKGFPKVKYFNVNFEAIHSLLAKIYQCAENGKLSADMYKLLSDFYNPLVETYQKKNNKERIDNKNNKKENLEDASAWNAFSLFFIDKIREWQAEFSLSETAIKFNEEQLLQTFSNYGDDTILYLREYLEKNTWRSKITDFLKADKLNINRNAFIETLKISERKDAKKLLEGLVATYNDRRSMQSDSKKKFSQTSLIINETTIDKAVEALRKLDEVAINHAFIAYADALLKGRLSVRKIFPFFFTYQFGTYSVIEEQLDYFNLNYSISK